MACEGSASDITLAAKAHPPLLPHPSSLSGERYHLPQLLPSLELENFNFPSSADGARGLMSITQALKQELTWTWSELSALWQHYLTPRTSAASFLVSLHLFICFPPPPLLFAPCCLFFLRALSSAELRFL